MVKEGPVMRKTWLAVFPIVLLVWSPLTAQQPRARGELWAVNHPTIQRTDAPTPPVPVNDLPPTVQYYLQPTKAAPPAVPPAPAQPAAPAAIGAPVVAAPAPGAGGCGEGGCGCGSGKCGWEKLRDWLCYQPIKGGCPKR